MAVIVDALRKAGLLENLERRECDSGETVLTSESNGVTYTLQIRFYLGDIGLAPKEITPWLRLTTLERRIEAIADHHGLKYRYADASTLAMGIRNKTLYRTLVSRTLDVDAFRTTFEQYLSEEVAEFFRSRNSVEGLGKHILALDFKDVVHCGIGGDYPLNVLKAITIAHACGDSRKFAEFKQGLQAWINEDRSNPKYSHMCDAYQGALDELLAELER